VTNIINYSIATTKNLASFPGRRHLSRQLTHPDFRPWPQPLGTVCSVATAVRSSRPILLRRRTSIATLWYYPIQIESPQRRSVISWRRHEVPTIRGCYPLSLPIL